MKIHFHARSMYSFHPSLFHDSRAISMILHLPSKSAGTVTVLNVCDPHLFHEILLLHMLTRNSLSNFTFSPVNLMQPFHQNWVWTQSPGDSALVLTLRSSNEGGMKNQSLAKRSTKPYASHMMSPSWTLYGFSGLVVAKALGK